MIQVEGICKTFGQTVALQDVSFHVARGEVLGFLGPNGAGKTTTMRILTGYLAPTAGRATVAGFDVFTQSLEVRRRIGYMPETVPLYPEMTVRSYLEYLGHLRNATGGDRRMAYAMDVCGILHHADTIIGKLSKGYRQRVGLAQALLHDPEVLILDEPTIGLDPKQVVEVRGLIHDLGPERTIILSTHILPEVSEICGRVLIINQGRIVAEDTPQHLTARLQGAERIQLQVQGADEELRQRLAAIEGVLSVELLNGSGYEVQSALGVDVRPQLAHTVVSGGWGLLEMRPVGMSLEEIFLKLTTNEADAMATGEISEEGNEGE
jgi:ABC-2 type transport system ATP-binding protein